MTKLEAMVGNYGGVKGGATVTNGNPRSLAASQGNSRGGLPRAFVIRGIFESTIEEHCLNCQRLICASEEVLNKRRSSTT